MGRLVGRGAGWRGHGCTVKIDKFMRESETFIKDLNSFNKRNSIKGNRNFYKGFQFLR